MDIILSISKLGKIVNTPECELTILSDINLLIKRGDSVAITGESGSGKTTLLGLMAGLDTPSSGSVKFNDIELQDLDEDGKALLRRQNIGFVFQDFQILPNLTALENVMLPLELNHDKFAREKAEAQLTQVGLKERLSHYPLNLSGGEKQRVAIARAFVTDSKVLFCDEPTGSLDSASGALILELLFNLNKKAGTTLVIVTHDLNIANKCHTHFRIENGKLNQDRTSNQ